MSNNEQIIRQIIREKFNGEDSPRVREEISRRFVLPTPPPPSSNRADGESVSDFYHRQKSIEENTKWNQRQVAEINQDPQDPRTIAANAREKLYADKLKDRGMSPHERASLQRQLEIARHERTELEETQSQEVAERRHQEFVANDEQLQGAILNCQAILNQANRADDNSTAIEFMAAMNKLRNATAETKQEVLQDFWHGHVKPFEQLESLQRAKDVERATGEAVPAIQKVAQAEMAKAEADHRARTAEINGQS